VLEVAGLIKRFRSRTGIVEAVRGVSFSVEAGEVLAFLGPNGAGKTTTIKMAAGLIRPDQGTVTIHGLDLCHRQSTAVQHIGAVLEGSRNLYWRLTVMENLLYWGTMRRIPYRQARLRAMDLLEQVGLTDRAKNTVQTLSRGMQQKVALCQALMHRPSVLLLDEPTLGLDFESSQGIKNMVKHLAADGTAILLTTHQLDVAEELSDRVAIIRGGQLILVGHTEAVLQQYSRSAYAIVTEAPLPSSVLARMSELPGQVNVISSHRLQFVPRDGDTETLYHLLDLLKPYPLLQVERHQADLAEVFQQVVNSEGEV
jgi:ABC-2 type transport system ATP-binding protein